MNGESLGKSWKPITIEFENGYSVTVGAIRKPEWQLGTHEECEDCKRLERDSKPLLDAWKRRYLKGGQWQK